MDVGSTKQSAERVFFIVDRSRLKQETDELKNAIVVYVPDVELQKPSLEQRCSQLVGICILIANFAGKLPKFIRLKSHGFAVRALGENYIMCLQSKFDEPKSCVIQWLDRIHNFFLFYYFSPDHVMKMSVNDWEIFTTQMATIFHYILKFTYQQTHSLPSMFNPLPYVKLDSEQGGTKLFLQSHRLLRKFQLHKSIIGGCLFYNGELLCSQLPPNIAEKLLLVANYGVELNSRSILADLETPESVWVIDVFLTPEELDLIYHLRRPHQDILTTYSTLEPNPNLTSAIFLHERAQRSQIDRSVRHKKDQKKDQVPLYRTDSGGSADFVTISYGSDSVSYSRHDVSPLKRPKPKRRFSVSYEEIKYSSDEVPPPSYNSLEPPPLPPKKQEEKCPPLPPKPLPPPVPQRNTTSIPQPPPRTTSTKPPPRSKYDTNDYDFVRPPPSSYTSEASRGPSSSNPPKHLPIFTEDKSTWIYGEVTSDETGLSPGVYGTPTSSLGVVISPAEGHPSRHDSDVSEIYGTPPSASPLPDKDGSLSTTTYSDACSHSQSFLTPLVISLADDKSMSNHSNECRSLSEENSNTDIVPNGQLPSNSVKETEQTVLEKQGIDIYHDSLDRSFHADSEEGTTPIINGVNRMIKEVQAKDNDLRSKSGISLSELKKIDFSEEGSLNRKRTGSLGSHHQSAGISQSSLSSGRVSPLRKISQTSNFSETSEGSLVITKAVSEPGSYSSSVVLKLDHPPDFSDDELGNCLLSTGSIEPPVESVEPPSESIEPHTESTEKQDLKAVLTGAVPAKKTLINDNGMMVGQMSFDSVDHEGSFDESDVRNLQDRSPLVNEITESTSEDENQMAMYVKRPRAETWIGFQTQSGQPIEKEDSKLQRVVPLERKTLYIQKCMNTVAAIMADPELPEDHELVQSIWTVMITQLRDINNSVESCVMEKEALYVSQDSVKPDTPRTYEAAYSSITGKCEVNSFTAPYQFRHAVRRAHHEFMTDPSIRQISLCKDHCRMFCQNIMGRESYLHSNRINAVDALMVHALLEKQAKAIKQQHQLDYGDGPKITFI